METLGTEQASAFMELHDLNKFMDLRSKHLRMYLFHSFVVKEVLGTSQPGYMGIPKYDSIDHVVLNSLTSRACSPPGRAAPLWEPEAI